MKPKKYLMLLFSIPILCITSCRPFNKGDCTKFELQIISDVMKVGETHKIYLSSSCKETDGPLYTFTATNDKVLSCNEQMLTITALSVGKSDLVVRFAEFPDVIQTKTITVINS